MSQRLAQFIEKYRNQLPPEAVGDLESICLESDYFEKTFDNSPCTITLIDHNGVYLNANKKMLETLNKDLKDLVGKKVGEITKDQTIFNLFQEVRNNNLNDKYIVLESIIGEVKKHFWISVNRVGDKFLVIGSDITDYNNLEEEKRFSDKMAFLGEMSTFIVHEINNPLMRISLANEIIQMNAKDPVVIQSTQDVGFMVETISKIIDSLKVFSRRDTNQSDLVSLESLFERSQMILAGKIRNSGVNIISSNLKGAIIEGSEVEFLQIMINLISNSIDAVSECSNKWINVKWEDEKLKIIDSGTGVPELVVPNLFQKFYTSKGNKGNGVGLYLSRELLNNWNLDLIYALEDGHTSFQWVKK